MQENVIISWLGQLASNVSRMDETEQKIRSIASSKSLSIKQQVSNPLTCRLRMVKLTCICVRMHEQHLLAKGDRTPKRTQ